MYQTLHLASVTGVQKLMASNCMQSPDCIWQQAQSLHQEDATAGTAIADTELVHFALKESWSSQL